jgi:hypothetical protein
MSMETKNFGRKKAIKKAKASKKARTEAKVDRSDLLTKASSFSTLQVLANAATTRS